MESYIILELVKLFPNKSKYKDFDWVVREVIRRKAIDFTTNYVNNNTNIVFENHYSGNQEMVENLENICIENSVEDYKKNNKSKQIIDYFKFIKCKINSENIEDFTDWDREFIEMVLDQYLSGCSMTKEDLCACMGYDQDESSKFNSKLNSFRLKCKNIFGDSEYV